MNEQLTFHCGLHKTGSTHLQRYVFPYMEEGTYIGHCRSAPDFINALSQAIPPVLCSDENFSGLFFWPEHASEYAATRQRILSSLASLFPGSALILFLREPSAMITSFYMQYLHLGGPLSFDQWLVQHRAEEAFDYEELLEQVDHMPWGRLLLFDYAQFRDDPDWVIRTTGQFVGCRFARHPTTPQDRSNVSVANAGARLLLRANATMHSERNPDGSRALTRLLRVLKVRPRKWIQRGRLRWLNRIGQPLVALETLHALREKHQEAWERTRARIAANQAALRPSPSTGRISR